MLLIKQCKKRSQRRSFLLCWLMKSAATHCTTKSNQSHFLPTPLSNQEPGSAANQCHYRTSRPRMCPTWGAGIEWFHDCWCLYDSCASTLISLQPPAKWYRGAKFNCGRKGHDQKQELVKLWWAGWNIIHSNWDSGENIFDDPGNDGTASFWFSSHSEGWMTRSLVSNYFWQDLCTIKYNHQWEIQ